MASGGAKAGEWVLTGPPTCGGREAWQRAQSPSEGLGEGAPITPPGEVGSTTSTHALGTGLPALLEGRGGGVLGEHNWVTIPGCDCRSPKSYQHETTRTPGSSQAHEFPQVGAHEVAVWTHVYEHETTKTPGSNQAHEFPQVGATSTHVFARRAAVCDSHLLCFMTSKKLNK